MAQGRDARGRFLTTAPPEAASSAAATQASEAAVKPMINFTSALKGFTKSVGSAAISPFKAIGGGIGWLGGGGRRGDHLHPSAT